MAHLTTQSLTALTLLAAVVGAGCSGSGRVEIKGAARSEPASNASIVPSGLNATDAAQLVLMRSTQVDFDEAVAQVRNRSDRSFSWAFFWDALKRADKKPYAKLDLSALLALHRLSCEKEHFSAYVDFVKTWRVGEDSLFGDKRECTGPLPEMLRVQVVQGLSKRLREAVEKNDQATIRKVSVDAASFLVTEYRASGASGHVSDNWGLVLDSMTTSQWRVVSRELSEAGMGTTLVELFAIIQEGSGALSRDFTDSLVGPLVRDDGTFDKAVSALGVDAVIRVLARVDLGAYAKDQATSERLLENLLRGYAVSRDHSTWRSGWTRLLLMRQVLARLENFVSLDTALEFIDTLHLRFETALKGDSARARSFLLDQTQTGTDQAWMSHRVLGLAPENLAQLESSISKIDRVLTLRVKARTETNAIKAKTIVAEYCDELSRNGITPEVIDFDSFVANPAKAFRTRGCVRVQEPEFAPEDAVVLSLGELRMKSDTVLRLPALDYVIRANELDGAILDVSADDKAHASAPFNGRDAVALPAIACINVVKASMAFKHGKHCFVAHVPYRKAMKGGTGPRPELAGLRAGQVEFDISNTQVSKRPTVLALEPGGRESVSTIDVEAASMWMLGLGSRIPVGQPGIRFYKKMPSGLLNALIVKGEKVIGADGKERTKLYVPGDLLQSGLVSEESVRLYKMVCADYAKVDDCLEQDVGMKLGDELGKRLSTVEDFGESLDLQESRMVLEGGDAGMRASAVRGGEQ